MVSLCAHSPGEAWTGSAPVGVAFPAASANPSNVFALIAAFVAGAFLPSAAFSRRRFSAAPSAGAPSPGSARVSLVLAPAWRKVFPAVAGISDPALGSPCLEQRDVNVAEDL